MSAFLLLALSVLRASPTETIWIEAEHLRGIQGYCWPAGPRPETDGHWGLSGPGWAAEWTQGGESHFLSIACGAGDDRAVASLEVEVPVAGRYRVWIRYRDNRGASERFRLALVPDGSPEILLTYGERAAIEEDHEHKLYWGWAFAWEGQDAPLPRGKARLELRSSFREAGCRQVDCIVLTTDPKYHPRVKERPGHPSFDILERYRASVDPGLEPLARRTGDFRSPASWTPRTFSNRGFLYLWNMDQEAKWAGDDPGRVPFPYFVRDPDVLEAFETKYAGAAEVPIFSDPRIVPTFHGAGPSILATDSSEPARALAAKRFLRWLDGNPGRPWATMMNYAPDVPLSRTTVANFSKYRDRYVGAIAGESLGYFAIDPRALAKIAADTRTRRELAAALTPLVLDANAAKVRANFGADWPAAGAYREVIPCQSIGMTAFAPLCYSWGARTVGYESSAITAGLISMRMAFLRGAARQYGGMTATYRSCNFGDASTLFSETQSYTKPKNILDNFYGVYSGAGMTWYKMDLWYQYLAGTSFAYHEQGFDEYWMPGGTAAAGRKPVELSPKGKLVDRFLEVTRRHPDRGVPFTPMAFLVDQAHGWDPSPFQPHAFNGQAGASERTRYNDHEKMLHEFFWAAYHPIGAKEQGPIDATNEVFVAGTFGDIFDVVYADPDRSRWTTIDTYPVVIAAGDIELTEPEGSRLNRYIEQGGTFLVSDGQLSGAGALALGLPRMRAGSETDGYTWHLTGETSPSQRFRYRPLEGGRPLASSADGRVVCASYDRGRGRLIVLSIPRGLGIDRSAVPLVPRLIAHLSRGLLPVEVRGDVEWLLNRTERGWLVLLLNPDGQSKPQQGITPTDFSRERGATIESRIDVTSAEDWLMPDEPIRLERRGEGATLRLRLRVPAGAARLVELRERDRE